MVAKTFGSAVHGVDAQTITVEVNISQGRKFWMSGLWQRPFNTGVWTEKVGRVD